MCPASMNGATSGIFRLRSSPGAPRLRVSILLMHSFMGGIAHFELMHVCGEWGRAGRGGASSTKVQG